MSEETNSTDKNKIYVNEKDATALAEAIRIARETTSSVRFHEELGDILDRLTPPPVKFAIRVNDASLRTGCIGPVA